MVVVDDVESECRDRVDCDAVRQRMKKHDVVVTAAPEHDDTFVDVVLVDCPMMSNNVIHYLQVTFLCIKNFC